MTKPFFKAQCWVILAFFVALFDSGVAQAQLSLLKPAVQQSKTPTAPTDTEFRQRAEAQFAEARKMQAESRLEEGTAGGEALPARDRQRILDRLVVAYGERLKLLDQIDSLKKPNPSGLSRQSLIAEFSVPPPFAAASVDLLRDELDTMRERLANLQTQLHTLEVQKSSFLEAQRRYGEAYRLADDRFARAAGSSDAEKETRARKLAELRVKLADSELSNLVLAEDATREEAKLLSTDIAEFQAVVTRAIAGQALTKEALDKQKLRLSRHLSSVMAELDRIVAANSKRTNERERLAKEAAISALSLADSRRLQFLDTQIETDRVNSITLGWLQHPWR